MIINVIIYVSRLKKNTCHLSENGKLHILDFVTKKDWSVRKSANSQLRQHG